MAGACEGGCGTAGSGLPRASLESFTYRDARALIETALPALCERLRVVAPRRASPPATAELAWAYTRAHAHSYPEVAVCLEGECIVRAGAGAAVLRPFEACVLRSSLLHNESCAGAATPYTLLWTTLQAGTAVLWVSRFSPCERVPFVVERHLRVHGVDVGLIAHAAGEASGAAPGWEEAAADYLRALYRMVSRRLWHTRAHLPAFLRAAVSFVEDHYGEPALSAARLAGAVGVEGARLRRAFQHYLSTSPTRFITATRMAMAAYLLAGSALPVREVAQRCGYRDPLYFSRLCLRWYGQSPTRLRAGGAGQGLPGPPDEALLDRWSGPAWRPGRPAEAAAAGTPPGEPAEEPGDSLVSLRAAGRPGPPGRAWAVPPAAGGQAC